MLTSTAAVAFLLATSASHVGAVPLYGQCGGTGYEGPTACDNGGTCEFRNEYYSQCVPTPSAPSPDNTSDRPGVYERCGGIGYSGSQFCEGGGVQCIWVNPHYSQCLPETQLADLDEPCGPATSNNQKCLLRSRLSGPVFMKCSSDTDPEAKCVLCGFRSLTCCPEGVGSPDRPPCQAAPRVTQEIECNVEEDICGEPFGTPAE